jgi:Tfp pilus assembly protein PilX
MKKQTNRGSVILATLIIALAATVLCGSFLALVLSEQRASARSLRYNAALNLAEAGIEQALYDLNNDHISSTYGWTTVTGTSTFYKKSLSPSSSLGGGASGSIRVIIDNYSAGGSTMPEIVSEGMVTHPQAAAVSKQIRVKLKKSSVAGVTGLITNRGIQTNGTNPVYDAYDSAKGDYNAVTNRSDQLTITVLNNSKFELNKGSLYGRVQFDGNYSDVDTLISQRTVIQTANNPGEVGATITSSATASGTKIDKSLLSWNATMNIPIDKTVPTTAGISLTDEMIKSSASTPLNLGTPGATTPTYYYYNGNLELSGKQTINIVGPVVMVVSRQVKLAGQSAITINPKILNTKGELVENKSAKLQLYVLENINAEGNGLANNTYDARRLKIYLIGSSGQNHALGGNAALYGMFYGPDQNININGNGGWFGSIVANQVNVSGNGGFHYDIQCGNDDSGAGIYALSEWLELTGYGVAANPNSIYRRDSRFSSF